VSDCGQNGYAAAPAAQARGPTGRSPTHTTAASCMLPRHAEPPAEGRGAGEPQQFGASHAIWREAQALSAPARQL